MQVFINTYNDTLNFMSMNIHLVGEAELPSFSETMSYTKSFKI